MYRTSESVESTSLSARALTSFCACSVMVGGLIVTVKNPSEIGICFLICFYRQPLFYW